MLQAAGAAGFGGSGFRSLRKLLRRVRYGFLAGSLRFALEFSERPTRIED